MGLKIIKSARKLPNRVVTNYDLEQTMDTTNEWIVRRTGIHERRVVKEETTSSLATLVAEKLVKDIDVNSIDLIIVATMSPDLLAPSTAAVVQGNIGAINAVSFDISAACSGFVYGLSLVNNLFSSGNYHRALLIGSETLSKLLNWEDRSTAVLFGDGSAGILLENDHSDSFQVLSDDLITQGNLGNYLTVGKLGADKTDSQKDFYFKMDGRKIYNFATKNIPVSIEKSLKKAGITKSDVAFFVLHQANERIIKHVSEQLDIDINKFPINIDKYGNTAAASEPILFDELLKNKIIHRGDTIVFTGFGGGLTLGTVVIKY